MPLPFAAPSSFVKIVWAPSCITFCSTDLNVSITTSPALSHCVCMSHSGVAGLLRPPNNRQLPALPYEPFSSIPNSQPNLDENHSAQRSASCEPHLIRAGSMRLTTDSPHMEILTNKMHGRSSVPPPYAQGDARRNSGVYCLRASLYCTASLPLCIPAHWFTLCVSSPRNVSSSDCLNDMR